MNGNCIKFYKEALWRSDYATLLKRGATSLETISAEMSDKARPYDLVSKTIAGVFTGIASNLAHQSWRFSESAYDFAQKAKEACSWGYGTGSMEE